MGGFGTVLGVSWALLGASGPVFCFFRSRFFPTWVQDGLQDAFWIDFGSILGGLGRVLGGFWEGLGAVLEGFGLTLKRIWKERGTRKTNIAFSHYKVDSWTCLDTFLTFLATLGLAGAHSLLEPPRWSAKRLNNCFVALKTSFALST